MVLTDHPVSIKGAGLALLAGTLRGLALLLFAQPTASVATFLMAMAHNTMLLPCLIIVYFYCICSETMHLEYDYVVIGDGC